VSEVSLGRQALERRVVSQDLELWLSNVSPILPHTFSAPLLHPSFLEECSSACQRTGLAMPVLKWLRVHMHWRTSQHFRVIFWLPLVLQAPARDGLFTLVARAGRHRCGAFSGLYTSSYAPLYLPEMLLASVSAGLRVALTRHLSPCPLLSCRSQEVFVETSLDRVGMKEAVLKVSSSVN